jgi:prepilin-type N-terminal cleavage/methylation domain-containing protein
MTTRARHGGFTFIEVLIVVAMASVLAAIGLPKFLRAQKNAKHSEAVTHLKKLHVSMRTQARKPTSIHVGHFDPKRGNRYSYHLSDFCPSYEDRSGQEAVSNPEDLCIGVDTFAHPSLPGLFMPMPVGGVSWDDEGTMNGMGAYAGIYGTDTSWDYMAYAAGDLDGDPSDWADTWGIASADGEMVMVCPAPNSTIFVPAGEAFYIFDDTRC